jgi:hypothetical protein
VSALDVPYVLHVLYAPPERFSGAAIWREFSPNLGIGLQGS